MMSILIFIHNLIPYKLSVKHGYEIQYHHMLISEITQVMGGKVNYLITDYSFRLATPPMISNFF